MVNLSRYIRNPGETTRAAATEPTLSHARSTQANTMTADTMLKFGQGPGSRPSRGARLRIPVSRVDRWCMCVSCAPHFNIYSAPANQEPKETWKTIQYNLNGNTEITLYTSYKADKPIT